MKKRAAVALMQVLASLLIAAPYSYAETTVSPRISVSAEFDDNNRLLNDPALQVEVAGAKIDALVAIESNTPTTEIRLSPRVRATQYPDESDDSATDGFLDFRFLNKGERSRMAFDASYYNEVTLGNFFPSLEIDPELGDPDPGSDTQAGNDDNRREYLRARTSFEWRATERVSILIGADLTEVAYDTDDVFGRDDFSNMGAEAGISYRTTETSTVSLRAGFETYDPDDGLEVDTTTAVLEYKREVAESYRVFVRAGMNFLDSLDNTGRSTTETGFAGGVGVARRGELSQMFFDLNYYIDPNDNGTLVNRTQARLGVDRRLTELLSVRLGLRYLADDGAPGDESYVGRSYISADIGLNYRLSRGFSIFGAYELRSAETDGQESADSNRFSLGFTWEPMRK